MGNHQFLHWIQPENLDNCIGKSGKIASHRCLISSHKASLSSDRSVRGEEIKKILEFRAESSHRKLICLRIDELKME